MQELTYDEVLFQIENQRRFGKRTGVEVSAHMLNVLSNPQAGIPIIHIAGTNGKGSVSAFLCTILRKAGLRAGMFTSPHLVDFKERIRVDGEMISVEDTKRLGNFLLSQKFELEPTMFDYCLMMAVLYFKEQNCDVMIIETGLGGRLDSTNALGVPVVSVITKIGYDHMAILGNTLEEIAREKAGIIKKGSRLVVESQEKSVETVLCKAAEEQKIEHFIQIDLNDITQTKFTGNSQEFSFQKYKNIKMQLQGVYQYENAAAALLAAEQFSLAEDITLNPRWIYEGIFETGWMGRMELVMESPFLLVDGAHNSNGVQALAKSLKEMYPGEKFHFIMGVMADKDYTKMVEILIPYALDFVTVTVESKRALMSEELADCITKMGVRAQSKAELAECIQPESLDKEHKTVAFGSLYFIGEIEKLLQKH